MNILGTSANGINVYDASIIGGHVHEEVSEFVAEAISKIEIPSDKTKETFSVDLGRVIGVNHLVETDDNDSIVYIIRENRRNPSRMVLTKDAEATSKIVLVLCVATEAEFDGKWVAVTAYAGELGEREPGDRSLTTPELIETSERFWKTHALVPTEKELEQIRISNKIEFI